MDRDTAVKMAQQAIKAKNKQLVDAVLKIQTERGQDSQAPVPLEERPLIAVTCSTGWEGYADGWRVELADGTVIGDRPLGHPHVEEQPFTRSTSGVSIPDGTAQVFIRARTNVEGWAEDTTPFDVPE